jgi:hypothetical protein
MATELLSFRLSGDELEWLKSQQQEGETLNLTAKRLLLETMKQTVDTPVDSIVDTPEKPLDNYTVIELRNMAKSLGIPYKVRDSKAVLVREISASKSTLPL